MNSTIALLAMLLPQGAEPAAQPTLTIDLHADASVPGLRIKVRDVATVRSEDTERAEKVLEVDCGPPPQAGYTREVSRHDLLLRLTRAGFKATEISFTGAQQSFVQPTIHNVTAAELIKAATEVLDRAILAAKEPDIDYKPRGAVPMVRVPIGRGSRELRARLARGRLDISHAHCDVEILVDGESFKTVPVVFTLTRYCKVLAAAHGLRPGTPMNESNVTWTRAETTQGTAQTLTSLDQLKGMVARRTVRAGEVLTMRHLQSRAVIGVGDIVELNVRSALVRIRTRVQALESGHVGKFIRVRRIDASTRNQRTTASTLLLAKVVSPELVVIDS
ncbi:MAG: flagellar basal body P-ring formation protein FlgA [Planctomycetes bacterium]|nr:flagellar basal body P-ring formation protein FlgA [Planctomycetota bacterium]MCB9871989.1 flagellar basal body P-ring formation protein FlgA [Planctomycetota bacterium]MCB9888394.1 flagellar basal body P-ring formation protein FlgA [Planctomycetota bacterium]